MAMHKIPNDQLLSADIPGRGCKWADVANFAATFNAYSHWEEPWEHSDWSDGIPVGEYQEMVRRQGQPAQKVCEVAGRVQDAHQRTGDWEGTLTELRTALFATWRLYRHMVTEPEKMDDVYDLLETIRTKVRAGSRE